MGTAQPTAASGGLLSNLRVCQLAGLPSEAAAIPLCQLNVCRAAARWSLEDAIQLQAAITPWRPRNNARPSAEVAENLEELAEEDPETAEEAPERAEEAPETAKGSPVLDKGAAESGEAPVTAQRNGSTKGQNAGREEEGVAADMPASTQEPGKEDSTAPVTAGGGQPRMTRSQAAKAADSARPAPAEPSRRLSTERKQAPVVSLVPHKFSKSSPCCLTAGPTP